MNDKIVTAVIAGLIGGIFGACAVLFFSGKTTFEHLEVGNLTITRQATLLDKDGKDDIVLKEGSVLANNLILGKKFIGTQYQGRVFVGNHIFTSPDDLVATPMEQWRFFTEIRSSNDTGGEMIVRSPNGANTVGQPVNNGSLLRTGFNNNDQPQMFFHVNQSGLRVPVAFAVPDQKPSAERTPVEQPISGTTNIATDPGTPKPQ